MLKKLLSGPARRFAPRQKSEATPHSLRCVVRRATRDGGCGAAAGTDSPFGSVHDPSRGSSYCKFLQILVPQIQFLHVQATSSPLRWPFFVRTAKTYMYVQYACSGQECLIEKSYLACNKVVETSDTCTYEVDQCRHLCALALFRVSL
jgi:hypothetical protein